VKDAADWVEQLKGLHKQLAKDIDFLDQKAANYYNKSHEK
jgi:hypothetical protein